MLPGDPDDANESTDEEEGKNGVAAQVVPSFATSPETSTSRSQPHKRTAPATSNESLATGRPVVKQANSMEKRTLTAMRAQLYETFIANFSTIQSALKTDEHFLQMIAAGKDTSLNTRLSVKTLGDILMELHRKIYDTAREATAPEQQPPSQDFRRINDNSDDSESSSTGGPSNNSSHDDVADESRSSDTYDPDESIEQSDDSDESTEQESDGDDEFMVQDSDYGGESTEEDSEDDDEKPQKRADPLLSFDEFSQLPLDVWLMVMDLFSPIDLLNLARSHTFFKNHVTSSPKKWGYLQKKNITRSHVACRPQHKTAIAGIRFCSYRSALEILLSNAYLDQFGYGAGWGLPFPEQYKSVPHVRAHTALLPVKGPTDELCRQIALLEPYRVAVYADPKGQPGAFGAVLRDVIGMNRPSLWAHFGREIDEMAILIEAKSPSIRAYMSLYMHVPRPYMTLYTIPEARLPLTLEMNPALLVQFHRTLIPAINTIIEYQNLAAIFAAKQWERREREIDAVVLQHFTPPNQWPVNNFKHESREEFAALYEELCQGRTDAHKIVVDPERRKYFVIRRGPESDEGLVVACINAKIVLATCDYTFGRNRIPGDAKDYLQALDAVKKKMKKLHAAKLKPLADKRIYEATMQEWANTQPYNRIPTREKAIDRMLDGRSWGRGNLPEEFDEKDDPIMKAYRRVAK